jgi:hypothetical protein
MGKHREVITVLGWLILPPFILFLFAQLSSLGASSDSAGLIYQFAVTAFGAGIGIYLAIRIEGRRRRRKEFQQSLNWTAILLTQLERINRQLNDAAKEGHGVLITEIIADRIGQHEIPMVHIRNSVGKAFLNSGEAFKLDHEELNLLATVNTELEELWESFQDLRLSNAFWSQFKDVEPSHLSRVVGSFMRYLNAIEALSKALPKSITALRNRQKNLEHFLS